MVFDVFILRNRFAICVKWCYWGSRCNENFVLYIEQTARRGGAGGGRGGVGDSRGSGGGGWSGAAANGGLVGGFREYFRGLNASS